MQISTWQHSIAKLLKRALFNPLLLFKKNEKTFQKE